MTRNKKESLEKLADLILLDQALAEGAVESMKNRHGFGRWMRDRGMIHASWDSEIAATEKSGFTEEQLDSLVGGADRQTRERYRKEE